MLKDSCLTASCAIAEQLVRHCHTQIDCHIASKLIDAMFLLHEAEHGLVFAYDEDEEICARGGGGAVYTLLASSYGYDKSDRIDVDEYAKFLIHLCEVNSRLKEAFINFKSDNHEEVIKFEIGDKSIDVLNKVYEGLMMEA